MSPVTSQTRLQRGAQTSLTAGCLEGLDLSLYARMLILPGPLNQSLHCHSTGLSCSTTGWHWTPKPAARDSGTLSIGGRIRHCHCLPNPTYLFCAGGTPSPASVITLTKRLEPTQLAHSSPPGPSSCSQHKHQVEGQHRLQPKSRLPTRHRREFSHRPSPTTAAVDEQPAPLRCRNPVSGQVLCFEVYGTRSSVRAWPAATCCSWLCQSQISFKALTRL